MKSALDVADRLLVRTFSNRVEKLTKLFESALTGREMPVLKPVRRSK